MPTLNESPASLTASFDSLIVQTHADFECLVVDESTEPDLAAACQALCLRDDRFHYIRPPAPVGFAASLNLGLAKARGAYIARFDGDDLCHPERLAAQVAYLEAHPMVDVVGCTLEIIDNAGAVRAVRRYPADHAAIAHGMQFTSAIAHPTVLIRASVLRACGGYDPRFRYAEDLELWLRLLGRGARFANLERPLLQYRQGASERGDAHWRDNLRARLRHLAMRHLPARLLGLGVIALWSVTPGALRRVIYRRVIPRPAAAGLAIATPAPGRRGRRVGDCS
jgi:glycosyltransferase involved in cell wall biosynthesis